MKTRMTGLICIAALAGSSADSALAQSYPPKAVRIAATNPIALNYAHEISDSIGYTAAGYQ